jgi:hypothetical protein
MKKTKQGVRDLGGNDRRPSPKRKDLPVGVKRNMCRHPVAAQLERSSGHVTCTDCGESWIDDYYVQW